jgi:CDP-2,3-bis-(O-geranylgeranyl)-sn-glycerol synthase
VLVEAILYILPAYFANATPVVTGGGTPLDFDKKFVDGKPIFGKNKTIKGFFSGIVVGTLVGLMIRDVLLGFLLSLGAMLGDLIGSFIKRRLDRPPGAPFPVLDQLDFIMVSIPLASLHKAPYFEQLLVIVIITPLLHMLTNFAAHKLKLKSTLW